MLCFFYRVIKKLNQSYFKEIKIQLFYRNELIVKFPVGDLQILRLLFIPSVLKALKKVSDSANSLVCSCGCTFIRNIDKNGFNFISKYQSTLNLI